MFAVIKTGGKQYKVAADDVLKVEKLAGEAGETVTFNQVLMVGNGADVTVGTPVVEGALVAAEFVETRKEKTVIVFKKRRRQNSRRRNGHRQLLTTVRITEILTGGAKPTARTRARPAPKVEAATADAKYAEIAAEETAKKVEAKSGVKLAKDDIKLIGGIGPALEKKLAALGVTSLSQIAELAAEDVERLDAELNFKGRIEREDWIGQAKDLMAGRLYQPKLNPTGSKWRENRERSAAAEASFVEPEPSDFQVVSKRPLTVKPGNPQVKGAQVERTEKEEASNGVQRVRETVAKLNSAVMRYRMKKALGPDHSQSVIHTRALLRTMYGGQSDEALEAAYGLVANNETFGKGLDPFAHPEKLNPDERLEFERGLAELLERSKVRSIATIAARRTGRKHNGRPIVEVAVSVSRVLPFELDGRKVLISRVPLPMSRESFDVGCSLANERLSCKAEKVDPDGDVVLEAKARFAIDEKHLDGSIPVHVWTPWMDQHRQISVVH